MDIEREYFYELVDKVPVGKLEELRKTLLILAMPEEAPTEEEIEAIKKGTEQIESGEVVTYDSFADMERDLIND